jgi:peptidyl-prolyl cis-trans isomerase-like protein 2
MCLCLAVYNVDQSGQKRPGGSLGPSTSEGLYSTRSTSIKYSQILDVMGKGTDKLYITHSEWASSDAYSASAGSGVKQSNGGHASFKRLPFTFCALSLQPFKTPVCTADGLIFDHENIIRWIMTHDTNPVNGQPLKNSDLIKLQFARNDASEYVDPVTFKVFTDNTHIVAVRHGDSANAFAYDTVERLNIKAKMWRDLVSDEEFSRKDIITLQDPQNLESRDLNSFQYIKDGEDYNVEKEAASINTAAMGSSAKILKAKEAVARARAERATGQTTSASKSSTALTKPANGTKSTSSASFKPKPTPYNASHYTTGLAAASLTSTGLTPHTSAALAILSDEEYLLKPRRVKEKGYVRLSTTHGDLTIELLPEHAPKAVWNFVRLAQKGYYNGILFHRNIRSFMVQGGDPTGTGRGGTSVWGKNFEDEFEGPLKHDARGVMSMANKGKNTNSSQFFITYRPAAHLDRKHTIFGKVVGGLDMLQKLEDVPVDESKRPKEDVQILEAIVFVDPFEEFWKKRRAVEDGEKEKEERQQEADGDERTTWTGKRIRQDGTVQDDGGGGVGKYLKAAMADQSNGADEVIEVIEEDVGIEEPVRKKAKGSGGFGNFDSW